MKKFACVAVAIAVVVGLAIFMPSKKADSEYFRLQVVANSNSALDQGVKYQIKDKLVEILTPYLSQAKDLDAAIKICNDINFQLVDVCKQLLKENNITYPVKVRVANTYFEQTENFSAGEYCALIVELGSSCGKNESCLIYPPLNINSKNIKFKSKIFSWLKTLFD